MFNLWSFNIQHLTFNIPRLPSSRARNRTEQDHLLDGRRIEVPRKKAGPQGYLSLVFLRRKDRRDRSEWIGEKLAPAHPRRRRQRLPRRNSTVAGTHSRISRAGAAAR